MEEKELWHGSPRRKLQNIKPGVMLGVSDYDRVYATECSVTAALFTLTGGPDTFLLDRGKQRVFLLLPESDFRERDLGGALYRVNESGFNLQPGSLQEWVAPEAGVIEELEIGSALERLDDWGYAVFADFHLFCDVEEARYAFGEIPESLLEGHVPVAVNRPLQKRMHVKENYEG